MVKIDLLFPKPLYIVENLKFDNLESILNSLIDKKDLSKNSRNNVNSSFESNSKLHSYPQLSDFSSAVLDQGKNFLNEMSYDKKWIDQLKIQKMWVNYSYEQDFIFPHIHGDCLIAGVYYVKAPPNATITFFNDIDRIKIKNETYNQLTYEDMTYQCIPQTLFFFKNDMLHGNKSQPAGEKIAISFNLGL